MKTVWRFIVMIPAFVIIAFTISAGLLAQMFDWLNGKLITLCDRYMALILKK